MPYSSLQEFRSLGLRNPAFVGYESEITDCLNAAQGTMHQYFRAGDVPVPLPEAAVDLSIKQYECWLAALPFMSGRGFEPDADPDSIIVTNYKLAMAWLKDVAARKAILVQPPGTPSEDGSAGGVVVDSSNTRGWGGITDDD